jgi:hypothetical protein
VLRFGVDFAEVIADYVRREVDFRRVIRELAMTAYGVPKYRWVDDRGATQLSYDYPANAELLQVSTSVPDRRDQERAARRLHEMSTGGKVIKHKVESGVPQRTAIDQWLDSLSPQAVQAMLGAGPQPTDLEVERVEDTVPAGDDE